MVHDSCADNPEGVAFISRCIIYMYTYVVRKLLCNGYVRIEALKQLDDRAVHPSHIISSTARGALWKSHLFKRFELLRALHFNLFERVTYGRVLAQEQELDARTSNEDHKLPTDQRPTHVQRVPHRRPARQRYCQDSRERIRKTVASTSHSEYLEERRLLFELLETTMSLSVRDEHTHHKAPRL